MLVSGRVEALCDAYDFLMDEDEDEDDELFFSCCFLNEGNTLFCFKGGDMFDYDYRARVVDLEVEMLWG